MKQADTIFAKIIRKEIPADVLYEDEQALAFRDVNPVAATHILIIPKEAIPTINDLEEQHEKLVGHLFLIAKKLAAREGLRKRGYRVVMNCNDEGGQSVFHIHLHLIGGQPMGWPPFPK